MSAGYRYVLKTDISRFFPTIYTHSVPWALHGKAVAKRNRSITPKYFGNLLDQSLRQTQDEQTFGLPIGPDTSHIVAEAIATSIDLELKRRLKGFPAGFRYVDDYYLFFSTLNEAQSALAALIRSLKDFELQINFEKTKTCAVLELSEDSWDHQLRSAEISTKPSKQASDINAFFELAKALASEHADESVMVYALKRFSSTVVRKENWIAFLAHLCHVSMGYPNTLQTIARLLTTYKHVGYALPKIMLSRVVNAVVEDHAPLGHHSEIAWALWMVKDLGLQLTERSVDLVSEMHSSVCALILLDLEASGVLPKAVKNSYWRQFESTDALYGDLWLLSYEAGFKGWAGFATGHIAADPHFTLLSNAGIQFYEPSATLKPIFRLNADGLLAGMGEGADIFERDDVEAYLIFEEDEGTYDGGLIGLEPVATAAADPATDDPSF